MISNMNTFYFRIAIHQCEWGGESALPANLFDVFSRTYMLYCEFVVTNYLMAQRGPEHSFTSTLHSSEYLIQTTGRQIHSIRVRFQLGYLQFESMYIDRHSKASHTIMHWFQFFCNSFRELFLLCKYIKSHSEMKSPSEIKALPLSQLKLCALWVCCEWHSKPYTQWFHLK